MRAVIYGMVTAGIAALALILFEDMQGASPGPGSAGVEIGLPLAALAVWAIVAIAAVVIVARVHHRTRRRVRYVSRHSRAMQPSRAEVLVIRAER